jgi:anti-sigma B factor antagonist
MLSDALIAQPATCRGPIGNAPAAGQAHGHGGREFRITLRAEPLVIGVHMTAEMVTVVVSGELDLVAAPSLRTRLTQILENEPQRLVFDMTRVGFIDCAAARLIASTGQFLPHNQRPVIRFPSRLVRRVLELTGLDDYCEVEK